MRKKTSSDHVYEEPVSTEEETFPLRPGAESPPLLTAFLALSANDVYTMAPKDVVLRGYDYYQRQPTRATFDGIHKYDDRLEDYSQQAVTAAIASAKEFRQRVSGVDVAALSPGNQLDHEQLLRSIDSRLLTLEVIRPWKTDPDTYSSGLTTTAYIMIAIQLEERDLVREHGTSYEQYRRAVPMLWPFGRRGASSAAPDPADSAVTAH